MSAITKLMGGGADGSDVRRAGGQLVGPDANYYQSGNSAVRSMNAPVNGIADQERAIGMIGQTAAGNGPSLARANMQAGLSTTNNAIQAQSMANQGNIGQGVSQRNMLNAQAAANNNYVNQAGVTSVAEQLGSQSNYANAANSLANNSLNVRGQQLGALQMQGQQSMALDRGRIDLGDKRYGVESAASGADANQLGALGQFAGNVGSGIATFGAAGGGKAGLAALSDEGMKKDKKKLSDSQMHKFMSSMNPSEFKYKDKNYSSGKHTGVMAQDVDDSEVGDEMVEDHGGAKHINVPKALGAGLASLAYLNKRMDKLEGKKSSGKAS